MSGKAARGVIMAPGNPRPFRPWVSLWRAVGRWAASMRSVRSLRCPSSIAGIDLNDLDVYVGVSSGGFVAAALANGISPAQMYRLFIDDGADASLSPALFLRPALGGVCPPQPVASAPAFWAPRWPVLETPTDAA